MASLGTDITIGVIGAGAMGAGIAQVAAGAGHKVLLFDVRPGAAEAAIAGVAQGLSRLVERGKISAAASEALVARLSAVEDIAGVAACGLVVEAVKEDLEVKRALFVQLEALVADDALLATNTSSLSVTAIGAALRRPQRLAGLHFFNPAAIMPLVEVISGLATDPEVAETLVATAKAWGKHPVSARSTPGFIVNRVARPFYAEGLRVLQERGADPATIDAVMRGAMGFRMGPFELMDLIGHDVNFAVTASVHAAYFGDPRYTPSVIQRELVEAGWLGRKTGRGFFDYSPDAGKPEPRTLTDCPPPHAVTVYGGLGPAEPLLDRLQQAGVHLDRQPGPPLGGRILVDDVSLALGDGRSATERAAGEGLREFVLFDLADWKSASRVALASADQAGERALSVAGGLFETIGIAASPVDDIPGLICLRTVAMLANEAADTVLHGVAKAGDVDTAMLRGVNYPRGPLAMADALGAGFVVTVLDNLARSYGEDRYRASILLRRLAISGGRFHPEAAS